MHICSRSIIFEPDELTTPVVKYAFRDMPEAPREIVIPIYLQQWSSENYTRL